jgi:hypothetical protein
MKYRHCFIERDAVSPALAFGFRTILFEMHSLGDAHMSASNGIDLSRLASPRIHSNARIDAGLAR